MNHTGCAAPAGCGGEDEGAVRSTRPVDQLVAVEDLVVVEATHLTGS